MTISNLIAHRLHNQQLIGSSCSQPGDVVNHFGAMQAQDYAMAKWAVGLRSNTTENTVEQAINNGDIIRTHVLRPTWHFIAPHDARWMLQLTAPRIKAAIAAVSRQLGLDSKMYARCNKVIEQAVAGKHLTREEIMSALEKKKIPTNETRSLFIMMNAEQDGIVCNGNMRGKQFTYALLEEKVPRAKTLTKNEALTTLAQKYFTSHGPATLADFRWWSGLTAADAKAGLEHVKSVLEHFTIGADTYWFKDAANNGTLKKGIHLLPAFDEFIISYKDRSASLEQANKGAAITTNGIFKPVIIIDGLVKGTWKRTIKKDIIHIETQYFTPISKAQARGIADAIRKYEDFTGKKVVCL